MLRLADTSIRMYRRKDGRVSLRLRSYLMVKSNIGFRLSAYLREISCRLTLASGKVIEFEQISYTEDTQAEFVLDTMVHWFWASAVTDMEVIRNSVGIFRMDYLVSFTGHPTEEPDFFEAIVPLIRKPTVYERW